MNAQAAIQPLYEAAPNWGHQSERSGVHWRGPRGREIHIDSGPGLKNDGVWRRLRVTAPNPADTLVFDLRDVCDLDRMRLIRLDDDVAEFLDRLHTAAGAQRY